MPPNVDQMLRMDRHGNIIEDRHARRSFSRHSTEEPEAFAAETELGEAEFNLRGKVPQPCDFSGFFLISRFFYKSPFASGFLFVGMWRVCKFKKLNIQENQGSLSSRPKGELFFRIFGQITPLS